MHYCKGLGQCGTSQANKRVPKIGTTKAVFVSGGPKRRGGVAGVADAGYKVRGARGPGRGRRPWQTPPGVSGDRAWISACRVVG